MGNIFRVELRTDICTVVHLAIIKWDQERCLASFFSGLPDQVRAWLYNEDKKGDGARFLKLG